MRGKLELRYLFRARLADGTVVKQTLADICPEAPGRSAFWPLLAKNEAGEGVAGPDGWLLPRSDIEVFELKGQGHRYRVDLRDGHWEIDGQIAMEIEGHRVIDPPPRARLSLIYFRRRRHHFIQGRPVAEECEYHMGWQADTGHSQTIILR